VPGAREALERLRQECQVDLVIVTSRQKDIVDATLLWLEQHYPGMFRTVKYVLSSLSCSCFPADFSFIRDRSSLVQLLPDSRDSASCVFVSFLIIFTLRRFGHHYSKAGDARASQSKPEMCAELGAVCLIDDSLTYANQCAATMRHVILFDYQRTYPWNQCADPLPPNVTRVSSWEEAVRVYCQVFGSVSAASV
jgi:hypothetical protein